MSTESWGLPKLRVRLHRILLLFRLLYETTSNLSSKSGVLFLLTEWDLGIESSGFLGTVEITSSY